MNKLAFVLFLIAFVLFVTPSVTLATHHICCSAGTPTATSCEVGGVEDDSKRDAVCTGGDICDNSTGVPACITPSGPDFGRIFGIIQAPSPIAAIPGTSGAEKLGN